MTEPSEGLSYKDAGVNIDAADEALGRAKVLIRRTFDENVLRDVGAFGAMYSFPAGMKEPVLVSSVDGVGTKLKLAFMTGRHDSIGQDLVAHCVNDILVQGARPLFFLDYLACGKLDPEVVYQVIKGLSTGCRYAGCALIGGETAEMPDMYVPNEYDLAGTIVGVVEKEKIVDGSNVKEGDLVIGLPSSGLHTNGYSLARKIVFQVARLGIDDPFPGIDRSVADVLLEPHKSYAKLVAVLKKVVRLHGMCHVTGGGITDNLPRTLPEGLAAEIDLDAWTVPRLFTYLHEQGRVEDLEMMRTFNMGIGYIVIVPPEDKDRFFTTIDQTGEQALVIGRVTQGDHKITYKGSVQYG